MNSLPDAEIVRETAKEDGKVFSALYLELRNACILFLSEGADSLGTVSISIPMRRRIRGPSTSSILLGDRNVVVARLLAERLSNMAGKVALVSVFTKTADEMSVAQTFLKLMERVMAKKEERR